MAKTPNRPYAADLDNWKTIDTIGRKTYRLATQEWNDGYDSWTENLRQERPVAISHIVSSEVDDNSGLHAPCIDIDVPVRLVKSSTPEHYHLYIEKKITWWQYKRILRALVAAGIVESGYYKASKQRKGTHLRLPWVTKETKTPVPLTNL